MNRMAIAQDTLKILDAGYYDSPTGQRVDITQDLNACLAETKYCDPDSLSTLEQNVISSTPKFSTTEFEVRNETTLIGAERMAKSQQFHKIGGSHPLKSV